MTHVVKKNLNSVVSSSSGLELPSDISSPVTAPDFSEQDRESRSSSNESSYSLCSSNRSEQQSTLSSNISSALAIPDSSEQDPESRSNRDNSSYASCGSVQLY